MAVRRGSILPGVPAMSSSLLSLSQLGWRAYFSQQLTIEDLERFTPARVVSVQRSGLTLWSEHGESHAPAATLSRLVATVGDWVLADPESNRVERLLERSS